MHNVIEGEGAERTAACAVELVRYVKLRDAGISLHEALQKMGEEDAAPALETPDKVPAGIK
jgi:hypothetical protein